MNYFRSVFSVASRLKCFWLLVIALGLVVVALNLSAGAVSFVGQFSAYASGALIGFACSAFFAQDDQFLLRGCRDLVYFVSNRPFRPSVYELVDRESLNALGGIWHEITHVSEGMARQLDRLLGRGTLSLRDAQLYGVRGERSIFAVLLNTRYGIPNTETLRRIWGEKPQIKMVEPEELDCRIPGRDLVSVQYWPEMDRDNPSTA